MTFAVVPTLPQAQANEERDDTPHVILIKNINVWDGRSDGLKKGFEVLVVSDKIRKVAKNIPTTGSL